MLRRLLNAGSVLSTSLLVLAAAACSGTGSSTGSAMLPNAARSVPGQAMTIAAATPPVTAPVTIPYPYTNTWTTTTWKSATAKPVSKKGSDTGTTTVQFFLDKKTGVYDVPETIKSKTGYTEVLNSAVGFLPHAGGIAQIILSDNYTYVQAPFLETGMDTYPQGQNSVDFPMTPGRTWSAAAAHTSYSNQALSGKGAYAQNTAFTENANGTYNGQTSYSSTQGGKNQDNYASTTSVVLNAPSIYTVSMRAAGFNKLTQSFALPKAKKIAVTSSGVTPLPVKPGMVQVPDWYPGSGALPSTLYSDDFRVSGTATMPSTCGSRKGGSATKVVERFANLDPVQGFYDTYTATYYLTKLAKNQFWFACIIEDYENDTYANGWIMNAGSWGGLSSQQIGTEVLIASTVKAAASPALARAIASLPVLAFPPVIFRAQFAH
jgi:hypothetical protein